MSQPFSLISSNSNKTIKYVTGAFCEKNRDISVVSLLAIKLTGERLLVLQVVKYGIERTGISQFNPQELFELFCLQPNISHTDREIEFLLF